MSCYKYTQKHHHLFGTTTASLSQTITQVLNFCQNLVAHSESLQVVLNIWNISHGPHVYPKKYRKHVSEFLDDKDLQYHIGNTFGTHIKDFVMGLAQNEYNLQYLPTKLFLKILKLLAARDIVYLSQTSKIFFEVNAELEVVYF